MLAMGVMLCLPKETAAAEEGATEVRTAQELVAILKNSEEEATRGKTYSITSDLTIDTNLLREGLTPETVRCFAGDLEGNGHTITVDSNGEAAAPVFEELRGSVRDLKLVVNGDVLGAPFAYDVSYREQNDGVVLENLAVEVNGDVLYADHDYSDYYASVLSPPYNYGNWYIHYGGQPEELATGFAWYLWGVSVSDTEVTIHGNVGEEEAVDKDATSTGFAYFAAKGASGNEIAYRNINVDVKSSIWANTNDGHASAYGFATGTADSTAGFGCDILSEISHVTISAQNISASSQKGASSAIGFARYVQGYTHDCSVNVSGKISAVNVEGDDEEDEYAYSNGDAYAYGFMLNTGGSINGRRSFVDNQVNVGSIYAKTSSETYAGSAYASGFANQMMNTANSVPDLSYHTNQVKVTDGDIGAEANKGGAVASGFASSSGRDYYDRPDHIYENSVYVNGSILAVSQQADATAAGYSYKSSTHRRACSVTVEEDIIAQSPTQAVASGFNGLQNVDNYYFINDATVVVQGDIKAVQIGDQEGIAVAGGLNAVVMQPSSGSATNKITFNGNRVEVYGEILAECNASSSGYTGLVLAFSEHSDAGKGRMELNDNWFVGKESILEIREEDRETYAGTYTNFTGSSFQQTYLSAAGNKVQFLREGSCPYSADVEMTADGTAFSYGDLWALSNKKTEHSVKKEEKKEPSCTEDGNIEYWYCTACGKYFEDEALEKEITADQTILKALGHRMNEAWSFDENSHWRECGICGEKGDQGEHRFEWIIDQEATETENGSRHEECMVCGYRKDAVSIPAGGTPEKPDAGGETGEKENLSAKTGDKNSVVLWPAVMSVSGMALLGAAVSVRRRKDDR